jgi:predicted phage replisome organizer
LLAGNVNDGGNIYLTPEIPYTDEMLANELRRPLTTVRMALSIFEKFGMIEIIDDILHLSSWEKYQNIEGMEKIREQTRKRVAEYREKKRLAQGNAECNVTVTLRNDIEEEGDKEKDKEFHSFTHSIGDEDEDNEDSVDNSVDNSSLRQKYIGGTLGRGVVMLSEEQFNDLLEKLSFDEFNKYVEIVADCEEHGQHYKKKTHYQAILDMVEKDRRVNKKG